MIVSETSTELFTQFLGSALLPVLCRNGVIESAQLIDQRLRFLQIGGIEAFSEPVVDRSEHRARLVATVLFDEQPRQ